MILADVPAVCSPIQNGKQLDNTVLPDQRRLLVQRNRHRRWAFEVHFMRILAHRTNTSGTSLWLFPFYTAFRKTSTLLTPPVCSHRMYLPASAGSKRVDILLFLKIGCIVVMMMKIWDSGTLNTYTVACIDACTSNKSVRCMPSSSASNMSVCMTEATPNRVSMVKGQLAIATFGFELCVVL